jgi:hypothetical protein
MPKIPYRFRKPRDKERLAVVVMAAKIVEEYESKGYDLTLRQLYYVFIARDLLPVSWIDREYNLRKGLDPDTKNTDKNYKRLGGVLDDGRMMGLVDWDSIVDRTRRVISRSSWASPHGIIDSVYDSYHLSRWTTQNYWPEVWVEKEALAGVFEDICRQYDLPLFCCRGYGSQSAYWRAAQRLARKKEQGYEPVILHFGDHDPSGIDMTRDIDSRLAVFKCPVEVRRLALNMDQIQQYDPPPNPAKKSDARFNSYCQQFGIDDCWELDALTPEVLNALVVTEVDDLRDMDAWKEVVAEEQQDRSRFHLLKTKWAEIAKYIDDTYKKDKKASLKALRNQSSYRIELGEEVTVESAVADLGLDDPDVYDDKHFEDCAACGASTLIVELDRNEKKSGGRYCDPCEEDESIK